ncbi:hypothetical protein [Bradyrhizobium shewense]|uniref:hypothetical protein n=1 Tax=Bradyrhizobium shewense TaxID=1761772 RepID=UPI00101AE491|nr:hypothetical protein [Bradyrhizobium shewense]
MVVFLSDTLGIVRRVLWRSQVMTASHDRRRRVSHQNRRVGGTGLIASKSVAILRHCGHEMIATHRVGVNTITADGPKEAPVEPPVVIDLSHWPSLAQGGVGILRDIFIAA